MKTNYIDNKIYFFLVKNFNNVTGKIFKGVDVNGRKISYPGRFEDASLDRILTQALERFNYKDLKRVVKNNFPEMSKMLKGIHRR